MKATYRRFYIFSCKLREFHTLTHSHTRLIYIGNNENVMHVTFQLLLEIAKYHFYNIYFIYGTLLSLSALKLILHSYRQPNWKWRAIHVGKVY